MQSFSSSGTPASLRSFLLRCKYTPTSGILQHRKAWQTTIHHVGERENGRAHSAAQEYSREAAAAKARIWGVTRTSASSVLHIPMSARVKSLRLIFKEVVKNVTNAARTRKKMSNVGSWTMKREHVNLTCPIHFRTRRSPLRSGNLSIKPLS